MADIETTDASWIFFLVYALHFFVQEGFAHSYI